MGKREFVCLCVQVSQFFPQQKLLTRIAGKTLSWKKVDVNDEVVESDDAQ